MLFAALREFIPFFPLYPLLFADTGLSTAQISSLFVLWSASAFVLEVPSGTLADLVSRRLLLQAASLVYAVGFALWALFPSYWAFAAGFVCWSVSGVLVSGTFESYVYDVLAARERTGDFPRILSLSRTGGFAAVVLATAAAAAVYPLGGYALVGATSVGVCLLQLILGLSLPPDPRPDRETTEGEEVSGYVRTMRAGWAETRRGVRVRAAVLLVACVGGALAYDEYFPLLAAEVGASRDTVPLLVAGTVLAQAAGSALAGRVSRPGVLLWALPVTSVLLAVGALGGHLLGFAVVAVGYGIQQFVVVAGEIRLQLVIQGRARATVTSFSGLLSEVSALSVFAGFGLGSLWLTVGVSMVWLAVLLLLAAPVLLRLVSAAWR